MASTIAAASDNEPTEHESESTLSSSSVPQKNRVPIHLRLGAMTKTWKNKKSWRTEKVLMNFLKQTFFLFHFIGGYICQF